MSSDSRYMKTEVADFKFKHLSLAEEVVLD